MNTSSFARFTRSATSPSFVYVSNPVPDSSLCRAAAPRLRRLQLLLPARLPRSVSIAAELPSCIRFSCCSPLASTSAAALSRLRPFQLLTDCVRFGCCSPIASASNLLPNGVRFVCCSPIASVSTAAPRLCPFQLFPDCVPFGCSAAAPRQLFWKIPAMSTILEHSTQSSRFSKLKYEGRVSL